MGRLNDRFVFQEEGRGGITGLLNFIQDTGDKHESRLGPTSELIGAKLHFNSNWAPYRPGMARKLGWVELMQVISGYFDERHLFRAAPSLRYSYGLTHAYGIKIAQQFPKVIDQLKGNPESRRAVMYIGKPEDGQETEKPCMQAVQFQIRDGLLHTTGWARSWDACSGLPYDILVINGLAQVVAHLTETTSSTTTMFASSLHVYDNVWNSVKAKSGDKLAKQPPFSQIFGLPQWISFDSYREWAMDELNNLDNWKHGLPGSVEC